jgi:POT family proton-dependent oligopeptide transporter
MRALLVYYMTKSLGFAQEKASLIYGAYAAFVYFTPILGGWLADRYLGARRAVMLGSLIMVAGHAIMGVPELLYPALALIAIGSGLFLPSLPGQVRGLYRATDPRLGSAYNIYFVGINLGAILSPFVCGTLGELYGWHWGFGAAAIGMTFGLAVYSSGGKYLAPAAPVQREAVKITGLNFKLLIGVIVAVMIFRGAYEQLGNTLALWADADVDRVAFGFEIPGSWFQAVDPALVFLLTPAMVAWWLRQAKSGREPRAIGKMAIGALGLALSYLLLAAVAGFSTGKASWIWLMLFLFLFTASELFIIPVGLGLFARLAPEGLKSITLAGWYFASFTGNLVAGGLGYFWSRMSHAAFFAFMAGVAALASFILHRLERQASHEN